MCPHLAVMHCAELGIEASRGMWSVYKNQSVSGFQLKY